MLIIGNQFPFAIHHRNGGYGVAIHAGRRAWEMKYGTEAELLVQVLYLLGEEAHA